jgi:hypothetical protein
MGRQAEMTRLGSAPWQTSKLLLATLRLLSPSVPCLCFWDRLGTLFGMCVRFVRNRGDDDMSLQCSANEQCDLRTEEEEVPFG